MPKHIDFKTLLSLDPATIIEGNTSILLPQGSFSITKISFLKAGPNSPNGEAIPVVLKAPLPPKHFIQPQFIESPPPSRYVLPPYLHTDEEEFKKAEKETDKKRTEWEKRMKISHESIQNEVNIRSHLGPNSHIVHCFGVLHTNPESPALVLQYASNGSIRSYLENNTLTEPQILQLTLDIISALLFLHNKRVIFNDLCWDNVLINSNMRAELCDLGFARELPKNSGEIISQDQNGYGPAKINWVAPEASGYLQAAVYSTKSDLYSFACLIWSLYSRMLPHKNLKWSDYDTQSKEEKYALVYNQQLDKTKITHQTVQELAVNLWSINPNARHDTQTVYDSLKKVNKKRTRSTAEQN